MNPMARFFRWLRPFLGELKRRNVYRVAAAYALVGWIVIQGADIVFPRLHLPGWTVTLVIVMVALGFPLALLLAWALEVTPEGVRRTKAPDEADAGLYVPRSVRRPSHSEPPSTLANCLFGSRRRWFIAGAVAMLGLFGVLAWVWRTGEAAAFQEGDALVLADFRNQTADPIFTGSLTTAFRLGLEQSPYLNIHSARKVDETLAQMRLDPDATHLSGPLAREVAEREGVPVAVVPSISEVGSGYMVGFSAYETGASDPVGTEAIRVKNRDALLDALDELTLRLRNLLGESGDRIERFHKPLADVTTRSLEALKLFSRADEYQTNDEWAEARRLLGHALEVDSNFTMARAELGMMEMDAFDQAKGEQLLRQVIQHTDDLTDYESLKIRAVYAGRVEGNLEKEAGLHRLLIELYPHRHAPYHNLCYTLFRLKRPEAAAPCRKALQINPSSDITYILLNWIYFFQLGQIDSALAATHRWIDRDSTFAYAWNQLGWIYLGIDSFEAAQAAFQRSVQLDPEGTRTRWRSPAASLSRLGHTYRLRGRYDSAAAAFRRALEADSTEVGAHYMIGDVRRRQGREGAARRQFQTYLRKIRKRVDAAPDQAYHYVDLGRALARLGEDDRAEKARQQALARSDTSASLQFGLALLAGARGEDDRAMQRLRTSFEQGYHDYIWAKIHPDLSGLANQPRFRQMLDSLLHTPDERGGIQGGVQPGESI